jgi:hypothetical protein
MTAATSSSSASGRSIDVNGVALCYERAGMLACMIRDFAGRHTQSG